jgi:hypothetical protein
VERLATNLGALLRRYVEGDAEGFEVGVGRRGGGGPAAGAFFAADEAGPGSPSPAAGGLAALAHPLPHPPTPPARPLPAPQHSQRAEAARLADASFGDTLLHCIGQVYASQADIYLGGLLDSAVARVRQSRQTLRCGGGAARGRAGDGCRGASGRAGRAGGPSWA